ncbi:MAG: glycoside hydrolase family 2 protein [Candidatus Symbiothrix sp.]|jgi:beta-galactosidase|nr:glycoside hydrolase family 2 protein [Candidatus Symbiothrix sp.]
MKKIVFVLLFGIISVSAPAREVVNLNRSWKFTPGYEVRKNVFTEVNLPHTWNLDALSGKANYDRGLMNYEKSIDIPASWEGKSIYLRFKGVNSVATVFVNGKCMGEHRGGYTAFVFDITPYVTVGKANTVMVRVNNAMQLDVMPLLGDFNMYGGIYRDVELIVTEPEHISLTDYASSGVYLTPQINVGAGFTPTLVNAKIVLTGRQGISAFAGMTVRVRVGDVSQETAVKNDTVNIPITITKPHLWQGAKDPYLYTVETTLIKDGQEIDRVIEQFGIRQYNVDPNNGFFLNGEHVQLRGVCRHQDHAMIGNALYPANHREDMDLMREMGVNAIRLAHYPQDKMMYDLCDEYGFVVWAEIPFIGPGGYRDKGFVDQQSFKDNGKQQLLEMIHQNYNHPSICFWGLFNELNEKGDNPGDYIRELNDLAHATDPTRKTTAATNISAALNKITDVMAWNNYFGWYGSKPSSIGTWADRTHKEYPNTPIGISEYGAGASIYQQQDSLKQPDPGSYWHPENWQTYFHEEHWKAIDSRPFLWGTFVWNMFDFGAAHRTEGEIKGINDKGLVTFDRATRKDAFYFYKANWNTSDAFVYIAERRRTDRSTPEQQIKIYSNQPEVELVVNGRSLGKKRGDYGTFIYDITLVAGKNTITARSGKTIKDSVIFVLR